MSQAIDAFMRASGLQGQLFPPNSRYAATETARMTRPDGTELIYLRRRFVPRPEGLIEVQTCVVAAGDRLDNLAARLLGEPELYWRLCDANRALRPDELIELIGRRLRVTLPEGLPGPSGA